MLAFQKFVIFWAFCSTALFVDVQSLFGLFKRDNELGDFIIPDEAHSQLQYHMSQKHPQQIVLYKESAQTAIVIDSLTGLVAIEGLSQRFIIDTKKDQVYKGHVSQLNIGEHRDYKDYNITRVLESGSVELCHKNCDEVKEIIETFCENFMNQITYVADNFVGSIWKAIKLVLGPILIGFKKFGAVLDLGAESGWTIYKYGILALLNIFKWLGKLFGKTVGGIGVLVDQGIKIVLHTIISAANGALALYEILKLIASEINLMTIMKKVLQVPEKLCEIITGLGGVILRGVTGIFGIIRKLLKFSIDEIFNGVKSISIVILDFLRGGRTSIDDVSEACDKLLDFSRDQKEKYGNPDDYEKFDEFILAVKGQGDFKKFKIPIAKVVALLTDVSRTAKDILFDFMKLISPVASLRITLPILMFHLIQSLNSTEDHSYVKQVFPEIDLPDNDGLQSEARQLAAEIVPMELDNGESLEKIPTPDVLKKLPIIKDIYNEFDEIAMKLTNSSLQSLLENTHVKKLVGYEEVVDDV